MKKFTKNNREIYKPDIPTMGFLRAFILLFVIFTTLIFMPNYINNRLLYVLLSSLIISATFSFSAYKLREISKNLNVWFLIKFASIFLVVFIMLFIVMYQK